MQFTHPGPPVLARRLAGAALSMLALAALAAAFTGAAAKAASASSAITVRVEGPRSTLLPATAVTLGAGKFTKNGIPADSCPGTSAGGALQVATHGDWVGSWSASYHSYFLSGIDGITYPENGAEYWAFWVNDAPSATGICSYQPKAGDSLLFFPDCYGKKCPKNAGVLGVKAPSVVRAGKPFTVFVTAYSDAKGTPSQAAGATVRAGALAVRTTSAGAATLTLTHAGRVTLAVSEPDAVRTEASVCVATATATSCP
jgi:hypothetical protein